MVGVFILVLQYKDINSSQFVGIFKVKTTSLYGAKKRFILLFFSRPSKSAFSRHGNVRASSTLFVWLNENVRKPHFFRKSVYTKLFVVALQVSCTDARYVYAQTRPSHNSLQS